MGLEEVALKEEQQRKPKAYWLSGCRCFHLVSIGSCHVRSFDASLSEYANIFDKSKSNCLPFFSSKKSKG